MARTKKPVEVEVINLRQDEVTFCLLGTTPFYCNAFSEKAKNELLLPRGRMTAAQKAHNLKHNPEAEFRASIYRDRSANGPTRIVMKSTALKGGMATAALDMPTNVAKTQINRLVTVLGETIPIWGIPQLAIDPVIQAGISRAPDMRTRAKLREWATLVHVRFTLPMVTQQTVATLVGAAGMIIGMGDFRQEKGKGSNGLFEVVPEDDQRWQRLVKTAGREAQDEALANPNCFDEEAEELLQWFREELARRGTELPEEAENDDDDPDPEAEAAQ
jgi:hypothetical protein